MEGGVEEGLRGVLNIKVVGLGVMVDFRSGT